MPIQNLKSVFLGNKGKIAILVVFLFFTSVLFLFLNYKTSSKDQVVQPGKQEEVFEVTPQAVSSVTLSLISDKTPLYTGETANISLKTVSVPASYKFLGFIASIKVPKDFDRPVVGANAVAFPGITYDFPFSQVVEKTDYWEVQVLGANSKSKPLSLTNNTVLFTFPIRVATATTAIKTSIISFVNISASDIPSVISADETLASLTTNDLAISLNEKINQSALTITTTSGTAGTNLTLGTSGGSGTGAVSYALSTSNNTAGCTLSGAVLSSTTGGSCKVTATKAASGIYNIKSSAETTITLSGTNQSTLTITTTSGTAGTALTLGTSGGSGTGAVSYALSTSNNTAGCTLSGAVLSSTTGGSCKVTATKAASGIYNIVSSALTTITLSGVKGDLDGNGSINVVDVQNLVVLIFAGSATTDQIARGDMNSDGRLDVRDAFLIIELIF